MKRIFLFLVLVNFVGSTHSGPKPHGAVIVVSTGWSDDGKGKVCDWLAKDSGEDGQDIFFVRGQGSSGTGHTVEKNGKKYVLYYIPVGILTPKIKCYLGPGMIIEPKVFFDEIEDLQKQGITVRGRVRVSTSAHLLMPYHKLLDVLGQKSGRRRGAGTILTGAGHATADKRLGIGIRIADLMDKKFPEILKVSVDNANAILTKIHKQKPLNYNDIYRVFSQYKLKFKPFVRDRVELKINQLLAQGKRGIFEAAHGTFLDITHGTYPYVSATSTIAGGVCSNIGLGPTRVFHTLGVAKAYITHPGVGPFPTEIKDNKVISTLRKSVAKQSSSQHRYGWVDVVMLRQAILLNGIDSLAISRLDDLDDLDEIRICIDYDLKDNPKDKEGKHFDYPPPMISQLEKVQPHYVTIKGWKQSTKNAKTFSDLPQQARDFVTKIKALCDIPISLISVGPRQDQMILVEDFFS